MPLSVPTVLYLPHRRGCVQYEDAHHHERTFKKNKLHENLAFITVILAKT